MTNLFWGRKRPLVDTTVPPSLLSLAFHKVLAYHHLNAPINSSDDVGTFGELSSSNSGVYKAQQLNCVYTVGIDQCSS